MLLVAVVLVLLVACSAEVHANGEPMPKETAVSADEAGLTKENFSAVAVQLEAVARAEGRAISDRMLHAAFSAAAARNTPAVTPAGASEGTLNVIVVPESRPSVSLEKVLLAAFLLFSAVLTAVSVYLRRRKQRRSVYKPIRTAPAPRNYYANYGTVRTYR